MALFSDTNDLDLWEEYNKEMYQLYYNDVKVWKLSYLTATADDMYHDDVNIDIAVDPSYTVPGAINVQDWGQTNLTKAGQKVDRQLFLFLSRKLLEDTLTLLGMDKYNDIPNDGDVVWIQDNYWEVLTVNPEGYHMNERRFPFDYRVPIKPWHRDAINRPRFKRR